MPKMQASNWRVLAHDCSHQASPHWEKMKSLTLKVNINMLFFTPFSKFGLNYHSFEFSFSPQNFYCFFQMVCVWCYWLEYSYTIIYVFVFLFIYLVLLFFIYYVVSHKCLLPPKLLSGWKNGVYSWNWKFIWSWHCMILNHLIRSNRHNDQCHYYKNILCNFNPLF
jgi:hypothetical protein